MIGPNTREIQDPWGRVPDQMKQAKRWLVHKDKKPFYVNGGPRYGTLDTPDEVSRLSTFEQACDALNSGRYSGIGFALGSDNEGGYWQGIDFDHIDQTPELEGLVNTLPGYVERSPSGQGVHAIGYGKAFQTLGKNQSNIECYCGGRFFTVTGDACGTGAALSDLSPYIERTLRPIHARAKGQREANIIQWPVLGMPEGTPPPPFIRGGHKNHALCANLPDDAREFPATPANIAKVRSALDAIPARDEGVWRDVVWALAWLTSSEGWAEVKDLARAWSETVPEKFDPAAFEDRWNRGVEYRGEDRIKVGTLFRHAEAHGWTPPRQGAPDDAGGRMVRVDLSNLMTDVLEGPHFIVERLVPRGHCTLFGGHGESGKTYVALALCMHVALGASWGGLQIDQGRVLFVSLEDDAKIILHRSRRIIEGYGLTDRFADIEANLRVIDGSNAGPLVEEVYSDGQRRIDPTWVYEKVAAEVDAFTPRLICIDNSSDAFDGDENNRRHVRTFVKRVTALGKRCDAAVILLAHINKVAALTGGAGNNYSGSTQWHNSVRSRIAITDGVLVHEKSNHGAKLDEPIPLVWLDGCWKPDPGGMHQAAQTASQHRADDAAILSAIRAVIAQGGDVRAADSGSATAWHSIQGRSELPEDLRRDTKDAKRRTKEATHRLADAGKIRREGYKDAHRNNRQKWVLVESQARVGNSPALPQAVIDALRERGECVTA